MIPDDKVGGYEDDRTDKQQDTHTVCIGGRDKFLSGLCQHQNNNGDSYAFWACRPGDADAVSAWVRGRSDIARVRQIDGDPPRSKTGHVHIYTVLEWHPALK